MTKIQEWNEIPETHLTTICKIVYDFNEHGFHIYIATQVSILFIIEFSTTVFYDFD